MKRSRKLNITYDKIHLIFFIRFFLVKKITKPIYLFYKDSNLNKNEKNNLRSLRILSFQSKKTLIKR